ncbi:MAG: type II secretion system F family protein [Chlamydiae bacterium]|nr:type II secretion system F family protein [Chlamydiota bacterium]
MPIYSFKAFTEEGKKLAGVIDADSLHFAKEKLKQRRLLLIDLKVQSGKSQTIQFSLGMLQNFTRELAQLLKAGLPLYESLVTIEEKYRKNKSHVLLIDLCDHLKMGKTFSQALSNYPKTFNEIYLSMIRAAEKSGRLAETFVDLSQLLSKQQKLKKQLFAALAYPTFLACFCFIVVVALFFFVIPSMKDLFEGRNLHPLTSCVLWLSQSLIQSFWWIFSLCSCFLVLVVVILKNASLKLRCFSAIFKLPFFHALLVEAALVRFCRAMSLLLSGGIPLLEALTYSRKTLKNPVLEEQIIYAEKKLIEGKKLSELLCCPAIPSLLTRMVAISEETGNMNVTMKNLSEIFEEELDKNLQQLTTFLQPAILLLLGIVVGVVVLSILLPLTDVSSFLAS